MHTLPSAVVMADPKSPLRFPNDVFPAELVELRRRRRNAGDPRQLPETAAAPTTDLDLIGLACSGGGIRSASFCLGVAQHLIKHGHFARIDYVSTVSGGGYLGSLLSALMQRGTGGERLLVDPSASGEPPALNHVRNGSNYLLPQGLLNRLRLPAIFLVGLCQILLLMLPAIVGLVFVTECFFELSRRVLPVALYWMPLVGLLPLLSAIVLRPLVGRILPGRGWSARDRMDRRLGIYALVAICSLALVPTLMVIGYLVNESLEVVIGQLRAMIAADLARGVASRTLWGGLVAVALLVITYSRARGKLVVATLAVMGPGVTLLTYLVFCAVVVDSPIVDASLKIDVGVAAGPGGTSDQTPQMVELRHALRGGVPDHVARALSQVLELKHIDGSAYDIPGEVVTAPSPDRTDNTPEGITWRLRRSPTAPAPFFPDVLTTEGELVLHVHLHEEGDHVFIKELALLAWPPQGEWWFYLGGLLLWLFNYFFLDINRISQHPFYRDRLSRTFLVRPSKGGTESADDLRLSELGAADSAAPYHLINCALNLQGSVDPQLRERKTVPFVLGKCCSGSEITGYRPTTALESRDPHLDLGTALAISAAAAAPNMGALPAHSLSFLMTMLNVRLNYWLPNPARADRGGLWTRLTQGSPGLRYLLSEALGSPHARGNFVNCSDGGHIENLGAYELLRRRCRVIVCIDGEADPGFNYAGLVTLQRYAQIDFNTRIDLQLAGIHPVASGLNAGHHAVGAIHYPDGEPGVFIYLKLSLSGDEPEYLRFYKNRVAVFPHESTSDQFFDETQFEVYRALGEHVAEIAFADPAVTDGFSGAGSPSRLR